jgi:hypothetical protein
LYAFVYACRVPLAMSGVARSSAADVGMVTPLFSAAHRCGGSERAGEAQNDIGDIGANL